jgi:hypothetical protein
LLTNPQENIFIKICIESENQSVSGICRPEGYRRIHLGIGYGANAGCKVQIEFIEVKGMPRKENFLIYFELVLKIRANQN